MPSKFHDHLVIRVNERLRLFNIPKEVCTDLVEQLYKCIHKNLRKQKGKYNNVMDYNKVKCVIGRTHNIPRRLQIDVIKELERRDYIELKNKRTVLIK